MKRSLIMAVMAAGLWGQAFAQTQLISNGSFESGLTGWVSSNGANTSTSTNAAHSGGFGLALTTLNGTEAIYQSVTIPANSVQATLSYFYNIFSVDGIHNVRNAEFDVVLTDNIGNTVAWIDQRFNTDYDQTEGTFHAVNVDLTPFISTNSGNLQLRFVANATTTGGTVFNVDDVSFIAIDASARGPNDNFANAYLLTGTAASMTTSNTFATKETGEPNHAGNSGGHSLWWRWTAPASGVVTVTTDGSNFDTLLAAYTGTALTNLTRLAANDDDNNGQSATSRISFPVNPGVEYRIAVDGKNGGTGTILFNLSFVPDTHGPTVSFTSPGAGATVTNTQVTVQGTAKDNVAVAYVEFRLENAAGTNDYQLATGTTKWSALVTNLIPGLNTVRVRAWDTSTNVSTAVARSVFYDIYESAKGTYAGLFGDTNDLASTNHGFFSATIATKGKLSGKLLLAGKTYAFSGQIDANSNFSKTLPKGGPVVQLTVDLAGGDAITGMIGIGAASVPVSANRNVYSRTHPAPQANQKFTLVISPGNSDAGEPGGYGFGALSVDVSGNVNFSGTLGDGTKVSQRTFVSKDGQWPLYFSATAGKELMQGWLSFTNDVLGDLTGSVSWSRVPQRTKLYPEGFVLASPLEVFGSRFTYTKGMPLLNLTDNSGVVILLGGNLTNGILEPFTLDAHNKLSNTNKLNVTLSTANGTFKGTVPGQGKPIPVSGALLQKQNAGFGLFSGTNSTGQVVVSPPVL